MPQYNVALITGAGMGIGRALALELASKGTAIAAIDVEEESLRSLAAELGQRSIAWAIADVADAPALKSKVDELEQKLGPIDLCIANAGIGTETSALSLDAAAMARIIGVNLIGVSNTLAAVLPGMLARKHGHLVAISSVASFRGLPRMLGYCASKSGVNAMMEGLRVEVKDHGIIATTICPSWIRTRLTENIDVHMADRINPDEAARVIVQAIEKRRAFFAFPRKMVWRLRLMNCLPLAWQDYLIRKMLNKPRKHARKPL